MRGSSKYTDRDYVVIDISTIVEKFVDKVDSIVFDQSYDIEQILLGHLKYNKLYKDAADAYRSMTTDLVSRKHVGNEQDAASIARMAIDDLFPRIDDKLAGLGYEISGIQRVDLKLSQRRRIHCRVLLAVIALGTKGG